MLFGIRPVSPNVWYRTTNGAVKACIIIHLAPSALLVVKDSEEILSTYLGERYTLTSPEEWSRTLQQGLNLFRNSLHQCCTQFLLLLVFGSHKLIHVRLHLPNERIHEECDPRPFQRTRRTFPRRRPEARVGKHIRDEGADDGGLGDDLIFQYAIGDFQAGDEAPRVDLKVPRLARTVERDDDFFVREFEGAEGDLGTVSPGTEAVGV